MAIQMVHSQTSRAVDNDLLTKPPSPHMKQEIISRLWGLNMSTPQHRAYDLTCDQYIAYYVEQCCLALHDGGRHASVRTHHDIFEITKHICSAVTRESLEEILRLKLPLPKPDNEEELLRGSVDLVAGLLSMVRFGGPGYGFSGKHDVEWSDGPLKECLGRYFREEPAREKEHVKLERLFCAQNLERLAHIEVVWTDSLNDHLRMLNDDKAVAIFHHATFLENQQNSIFPEGFVDETIRTLALLLPSADKSTRTWFRKQQRSAKLDPQAVKCGQLRADDRQIQNFTFWRDRLVILKQVFDEAEPQFWYRRGPQWYTFWIAVLVLILTVVFGVIQCIEGGLQAYKAFYPSR